MAADQRRQPRHIAILPWGRAFEEYLDPLGMSVEEFRTRVSGGWLFNYVRALNSAGIEASIVVFSARATRAYSAPHVATGAALHVVPAPARVRAALRLAGRQAGRGPASGAAVPGPADPAGRKRPGGLRGAGRDVANYLATPVRPLVKAIESTGCDAVLCQEYEYPRFEATVLAGRRLSIPVFATFQGGEPTGGGLTRAARRWAVHRSAGLIIGSGAEAARVQHEYGVPAASIGYIPNPLALEEIQTFDRGAARAELGVPAGARLVAWHGRVSVRTKGLDLLVDAWRDAVRQARRDDARLLLIGSGEDADWLRDRFAPELAERSVIWVDEFVRERDRLFRYLQCADAYVFPSRHEGFPVAPLEAMACGIPVVAARASGISDMFPGEEADGGVTVPVNDASALADAMVMLINDPDRAATMGAAARRRVTQHYSIGAVGALMGEWLSDRLTQFDHTRQASRR